MATWTTEVDMLAQLIDLQQQTIAAVAAASERNLKVPKVKLTPRPETAQQRVKARRRQQQHQRIKNKVLRRQQRNEGGG